MIACIDPGTSAKGGTGVAYFSDPGVLLEAFLLRPPQVLDVAERIRQTVEQVHAPSHVRLCIVEWPQIYKGDPRDPNHLLGLAGMAMAIVTRLHPGTVQSVLPRTWKGTLDGDAMTERIAGRLRPEELQRIAPCPASLRHNVLDAVGLGLWHLGRLERKRAFRR